MGDLEYREQKLLLEIKTLQQEVIQLKQANSDLLLALETITAHGDLVESELQEAKQKLELEIQERQKAEAALQAMVEKVSRDKDDLANVLQLVAEHGDAIEEDLRQEVQEAQNIALIDGLTQIANRRRLDEYLAEVWTELSQQQSSLAFILCDVDYFKLYNDRYGHLLGDECLKQVAQALASTLHRSSTDLVARYGGEEFAMILPHADSKGAIRVCQLMQAAIAELQIPHEKSAVNEHVTLSIGISVTVPIDANSPESLIATADLALYEAKQQGRNRYVFKPYQSNPVKKQA